MTETGLRASVVINTYNRAPYLRRLLPGLAHLRGGPFELVVVNGPSRDETHAVLEDYRQRIKLVSCPSRNLSHSRNLGIAAAAGDIVVFIDDDALPDDVHWLTRYLDAFAAEGADRVGAVGGPVWQGDSPWVEFNGGSTSDYGFQIFDIAKDGPAVRDGRWVQRVQGCNCAFRRTALIAIGGFDEFFTYYHDETDVCLRLARAGFTIRNLPDNWVRHYQAGSERRPSYFDRNWHVIARSDTYFALKNGADRLPRRIAKTVAAAPRKHYAEQIVEWRRTGKISRRHWMRLMVQLYAGAASGFWSGLTRQRRFGDFRVPPPPFVSFSLPTTERPLRIALLSQALPGQPGNGGVGRYTFDLARGLHERGHTVHLFCRSETPLVRESLEFVIHGLSDPSAAPLAQVGDRPVLARNLSHALTVVRTLAELEARGTAFDVVHASNWDCEAAALVRARLYPTVLMLVSPLARVIITERWQRTKDMRACLLLDRWQIEHADTVCVPSAGVLGDYQRLMGLDPGSIRRLRRVPLGIFPDESRSPEPAAGRQRLLFVGRCERRKGVHTLLAVLPDLLTTHPEWECHLVGDDIIPMSDGRTLKEGFLAEHRGAAWLGRVIFHGAVSEEELKRQYRRCDLFVAPSLFESFGLIYHEAMQYGKAVVGCRTGGVPEVVEDGVEGLLVAPDSAEELRLALSRLICDAGLRQRLAEAGARRIRERSNHRAMAERMVDVYRETIEAAARERPPGREQLFYRELPLFAPSATVDFNGEWVTQEAAPGHVYRMGMPGASLSFTATPDCMLHVVALRHGWSGVLEILTGDAPPHCVDLYKAGHMNLTHSMHVPITGDGDHPVRITLRVHSEHNPESQAGQVWLKQVALARLRRAEPSDSPGQVAAGEDAI